MVGQWQSVTQKKSATVCKLYGDVIVLTTLTLVSLHVILATNPASNIAKVWGYSACSALYTGMFASHNRNNICLSRIHLIVLLLFLSGVKSSSTNTSSPKNTWLWDMDMWHFEDTLKRKTENLLIKINITTKMWSFIVLNFTKHQ